MTLDESIQGMRLPVMRRAASIDKAFVLSGSPLEPNTIVRYHAGHGPGSTKIAGGAP
jgi:hypothetical protein